MKHVISNVWDSNGIAASAVAKTLLHQTRKEGFVTSFVMFITSWVSVLKPLESQSVLCCVNAFSILRLAYFLFFFSLQALP